MERLRATRQHKKATTDHVSKLTGGLLPTLPGLTETGHTPFTWDQSA